MGLYGDIARAGEHLRQHQAERGFVIDYEYGRGVGIHNEVSNIER